jgi:hypothetical protein
MGMSSSQNLQVARALARSNVDTQAIKTSSESSPAPSSSAFFRDNTAAHPPLDFGLTKQADGYYHRSSIVVARVSSLHEPSLRLRRACSGSRQHILGFAEEMVFGELSHNIVGGRRNSGSDTPPLLRTSRSSALFQ